MKNKTERPKQDSKKDFSYVLGVNERTMLDATIMLLEKLKKKLKNMGLKSRETMDIDYEINGQVDLALEALRLIPKGSIPFKKRTWEVTVKWPCEHYRYGDSIRQWAVVSFDHGAVMLFYGFSMEPQTDEEDQQTTLSWIVLPGDHGKVIDEHLIYEADDKRSRWLKGGAVARGILPYHAAVQALNANQTDCVVEFQLDAEIKQPLQFPEERKDAGTIRLPETAEEALGHLVDEQRGLDLNIHRIPVPDNCDICGCDFSRETFLIDGRLRDSLKWANMCPRCVYLYGSHIGWGAGQLFKRQSDDCWLCVAGFPSDEADLPDEEG